MKFQMDIGPYQSLSTCHQLMDLFQIFKFGVQRTARLVVTLSRRQLTLVLHAGEEQFQLRLLSFGRVFGTRVASNKYTQSQKTGVSDSCSRVSKKEAACQSRATARKLSASFACGGLSHM